MENEDRIYDLLEKMYIEVRSLKQGQSNIENEFQSLKQGQSNIENEVRSLKQGQGNIENEVRSLRQGQSNIENEIKILKDEVKKNGDAIAKLEHTVHDKVGILFDADSRAQATLQEIKEELAFISHKEFEHDKELFSIKKDLRSVK